MKSYICKNCGIEYHIENWRKPSSYCCIKCKNKKANTWLLKTSFIIKEATEKEKTLRLKKYYEKLVIKNHKECWGWKGKVEKGYSKMTCRKKLGTNLGHRASWIIHYGDIPEGQCVLHKCDNRICTNPEHLFLGTNKDNINDMLKKGRNPIGSKIGTSKLLEKEVIEIKRLLQLGKKSIEISKDFNVTPQAIELIKKNINWKHITLEEKCLAE